MKLKKEVTSVLLALSLTAALLAGCASKTEAVPAPTEAPAATEEPAADSTEEPAVEEPLLGDNIDVTGKLVILHTNDVHGRAVQTEDILGYTAVAALKQKLVDLGATVLLLDAGDASQGMPIVNESRGAAAMDFMNAVGYDAMALGNHEFDWNCDNVWQLIDRAEFPIMGANIVERSTGECKMEQHTIFTLDDGRKIGVFGIDTPSTVTSTHPDNVRDIRILMDDELYACAQEQIDALRAENCDMIIMLSHLGVDVSAEPNRSIDVLNNTTGIDLCVDGHSHTVMEGGEMVNGALLTSTGAYLANIGWVVVEPDGTMEAGLYHSDRPISEEKVNALVNQVNDSISAELGVPFGSTDFLLNGDRDFIRTSETNLGDLCTDAIMWEIKNQTGKAADACILNGGGIRDSIPAGEISPAILKTIFPFNNTLCLLDVTGAELLEALEASTFSTPESLGAFPQVSGIEYSVNTTIPFETNELYPNSTFGKPANPGSRVTIQSVGGADFDPDAIYTIATNDFIAAGGDTYSAFVYAGQTAKIDTGFSPEDAVQDYILETMGGKVDARYEKPQERIHITVQ